MLKTKKIIHESSAMDSAMDPAVIKKIAHLTDINNHTLSIGILAMEMKEKRYVSLLRHIQDIAAAEGHMPSGVSQYRHDLLKQLLAKAKKKYSNYDEIHRAF